jgi:hypothetical protein
MKVPPSARRTKITISVIFFACFLLMPIPSHAQDPCHTYQECDEMGGKSLRQRKFDEAEVFFALQAKYAEIADEAQSHEVATSASPLSHGHAISAYNNMALAYLRTYQYQRAKFWCNLALSQDHNDKTAQANLAKIEKKLTRWKWPTSLKGTYIRYAGHGEWYTIAVRQERSGKIIFGFSVSWMILDRLGRASITSFSGEDMPSNRSVTYHGKYGFPCTVRLDFSSDKVVLTQEGSCGLAPGIDAFGTFERVDTSNTGPYITVWVCEAFAGMRPVG